MMKKRKTRWIFAVFISGLLAGCSPGTNDGPAPGGELGNQIRVTGEIESANATFFGPPSIPDIWQYTISFMAPEGRVVQPGTTILKFDPQALMTELRDKSNSLNEKQKQLEKQRIVARDVIAELELRQQEAIADLSKAELKADIPVELLASRDYQENKLVLKRAQVTLRLREEEIEKEKRVQATEIDILEREIAVLEGEVAQLQASVDSMEVKASNAGVVIHSVDRRNNKHEVGDNVWMGRRVMELPDLNQLQVHLEIPERESARVKVGQVVRFVLDAVPDRQFHGKIIELASVIHTKSPSQPAKVFDATVSLENPDTAIMRPGMSVSADIIMTGADN
jgi:hypothetical protein